MSNSVQPHRWQPIRVHHSRDSPGKKTGEGCHFLLQCMKVKSLSRVRFLATPWTAAYQAPPSMGFSRQEYWSGVPWGLGVCILGKPKDHTLRVITQYLVDVQSQGSYVPVPAGSRIHQAWCSTMVLNYQRQAHRQSTGKGGEEINVSAVIISSCLF